MSDQPMAQLWRRLAAAGLAKGEAPPAPEHEPSPEQPWYLRTMLGCAGWLGALFVLGTIGIALSDVIDSFGGQLIAGSLLCAAAVALFRLAPQSLLLTQLGFAISLAGQALLLFAFAFEADWPEGLGWLAFAGAQAILFAANPDFLHRVWSAGAGAVALGAFAGAHLSIVYFGALLMAIAAPVWLEQPRWPRHGEVLRALGYGLALALVYLALFLDLWQHQFRTLGPGYGWTPKVGIGGALVGAVLLWTVARLLREAEISPPSALGRAALATAAVLATASVGAPGVGMTALFLWLGFALGERALAAIGIGGLLAYLGSYYYVLDLTLLEKSAWLVGSGALLLVLRPWLLASVPRVPAAGETV